jgi:hypothetical protein
MKQTKSATPQAAWLTFLQKLSIRRPTTLARLVIVVEYEREPENADIEEVVEKTREVGEPIVAVLERFRPSVEWVILP